MAKIARVEIQQVDLAPKVARSDAIQAFLAQETPILRITDTDGATGTGYCYTIGQGGSSVVALLRDHFGPRLIGREADPPFQIGRHIAEQRIVDDVERDDDGGSGRGILGCVGERGAGLQQQRGELRDADRADHGEREGMEFHHAAARRDEFP